MTYMYPHLLKSLTHRPMLLAIVIAGFVLLISALVINHESSRIRDNLKHEAFVNLLTLGARLEGEINSNLLVLRGLKAEVAINPDITQKEFVSLVDEYFESRLSIRHIALAPNLIITHIHPEEGNRSALGLDYRTVPEQYFAVKEVIDKRAIMVNGPVNLVQGGSALIARSPVFLGQDDGVLWGIIAVVIDDQMMFDNAGMDTTLWGLDIAVRGKNGMGDLGDVFFGSADVFERESVTVDVILPYGRWQLAASPSDGWSASTTDLISFWLIAVLVSLVLSMASFLIAANYREKLSAIEIANYRADFDGLTGLANRSYFNQQLTSVIALHRRHQQTFALFFIDLDFFKEVNDSWGHHAGDQLLRHFAKRMTNIVRNDDVVARLAGDEFVIVLKDIEVATQAELLAEKLQLELGEPYLIEGQYLSVTHSLGIAMYPQDGRNGETLLQNADRAMYEAKRAGKNRIYFFNEQLSLEVKRHVQVHNQILEGLRLGQFEIYFQPIMHLGSGQITKCEALIRWNHPERGLVSPIEFIPIAEQTGAIRNLGDWILEEVCHLYTLMKSRGLEMQISINRSVAEFQPKDIDNRWLQIIDEYQIDHSQIIFEITESLLMDGADSQKEKVRLLREQGICFSIDDFGTGYSAINYLRTYPVDYLKIDQSFLRDVLTDEQDRTLVEVIIKMGQTLGILVIAEGVETIDQLELMRKFGCDYIQGYTLGRPMPFDQFVAFCQQHDAAK